MVMIAELAVSMAVMVDAVVVNVYDIVVLFTCTVVLSVSTVEFKTVPVVP